MSTASFGMNVVIVLDGPNVALRPETTQFPTAVGVPEPDAAILAPRREEPTVGRKVYGTYSTSMAP